MQKCCIQENKMLLKEHKLLMDENNHINSSLLNNQLDLAELLRDKDTVEISNLEKLQQRYYTETIKFANHSEDIDRITEFISEFVKEAAASSKKRHSTVYLPSFSELHKDDQENINELLSNKNIEFK